MGTARSTGAGHRGILALVGLLSVLVLVTDSNMMKILTPGVVVDELIDNVQPALTVEDDNSSAMQTRNISQDSHAEEPSTTSLRGKNNLSTAIQLSDVELLLRKTKHSLKNRKENTEQQLKVELPVTDSANLGRSSGESETASPEKHQDAHSKQNSPIEGGDSTIFPLASLKIEKNASHDSYPPIAEDNIFSACMLTMDDNHFLIEWLSYHYHTLPLRDFIVAVDPNGKTSPSKIFDRWRAHGMRIEQWTDKDFMPPSVYATSLFTNLTEQDKVDLHRQRQNYFQANCIRKLKARGRTWTLMIDSDEYLRLNQRKAVQDKISIPSPSEEGAILKFLQQQEPKAPPCIMVPRLRVGTVESSPKVNRTLPEWVNRTAFQTLRFRRHFARNNVGMHKSTKNILDVSRIENKDIRVTNPHRTIQAICPLDQLFKLVDDSIYVVHHYLGTWEQFSSRNDARQGPGRSHHPGTYDMYKVADAPDSDDDTIQPWLEGFVNSTGSTQAKNLLQGVGVVGYDKG